MPLGGYSMNLPMLIIITITTTIFIVLHGGPVSQLETPTGICLLYQCIESDAAHKSLVSVIINIR